MRKRDKQFHQQFQAIFSRNVPEIERLAAGFHFILEHELVAAKQEMELLRALGDRDGLIKEQIKHNTIQHAASIFLDCYFHATGELWTPREESHA